MAILVTRVGMGELQLFRRRLRDSRGSSTAVVPPVPACEWISATPYIPARHLKLKNNRYTLEDDVRRELELRGFPPPVAMESFLEMGRAGRKWLVDRDFSRFLRSHVPGKPQPPRKNVFGVRVVFEEPVAGPIALGYASHFGLGLMAAVDGGSSDAVRSILGRNFA